MTTLTAERLRELLSYDSHTGNFTWRVRRGGVRVGQVAGSIDSYGYRQVSIDGRAHLAHRLAWLYERGEWPPMEIDHINCDRDDNRMDNLRQATRSQNLANGRKKKQNKSGFKGVCRHATTGKWSAEYQQDGKSHYLGLFDEPEKAHEAYRMATAAAYGEFARAI